MSDIRHTQSKSKIKKTLVDLLKIKDFDKISITDITRQASINRGTFYLHYLDKIDLLETIMDEIKTKLYKIIVNQEKKSNKESLEQALIYIKSEHELFQTLKNSSAASISNEIEQFLSELFLRNDTFRKKLTNNINIPEDYLIKSFCSAVSSIIIQWVDRGCKESPKEISRILVITIHIYTS